MTQQGGQPAATGLYASLKRLLSTLIEVVQTRLAIVSTEFEEERERVREQLVYGFVAFFFLGIGIVVASVFLAVWFWDTYRLAVLGGLAGLYLFCGALAFARLRHSLRSRPKLFAATLAECERRLKSA